MYSTPSGPFLWAAWTSTRCVANTEGYRQEPDVSRDSFAETYAAIKLYVDNWRWQDVPFYLCTGKELKDKVSLVVIDMRPVPHRAFPESASGELAYG